MRPEKRKGKEIFSDEENLEEKKMRKTTQNVSDKLQASTEEIRPSEKPKNKRKGKEISVDEKDSENKKMKSTMNELAIEDEMIEEGEDIDDFEEAEEEDTSEETELLHPQMMSANELLRQVEEEDPMNLHEPESKTEQGSDIMNLLDNRRREMEKDEPPAASTSIIDQIEPLRIRLAYPLPKDETREVHPTTKQDEAHPRDETKEPNTQR